MTLIFDMFRNVKQFFYLPGTSELNKPKVVSTIVLSVALVLYGFWRTNRNHEQAKLRNENGRFTIGITLSLHKNFRSPNPYVKFIFSANGRDWTDFQEIPNFLHGKITDKGGRYFVHYYTEDPSNCQMLLEYPVPDSLQEAPDSGWVAFPGRKDK